MTTEKPVSHEEVRELVETATLRTRTYGRLLAYISQRESAERELTEKLRAAEAEVERLRADLSLENKLYEQTKASLAEALGLVEQARREGYERGKAAGGSLLRPAVTPPPLPDDPAERAAILARGAAVHRSLKEPCTVHRFNSLGHCEKCGGRRDPT